MIKRTLSALPFLLLLEACGGDVASAPGATPDDTNSVLAKTSFELPSDGASNANGFIGPFCCTGNTVTVESVDGHPVGYAYFFAWKGQAYQIDDSHSVAPALSVLVAGLADASDPASELVLDEVDFDASEMSPGAMRDTTAGQLKFVVTIDNVTIKALDNQSYFDMGSLTAKLDVAVVP